MKKRLILKGCSLAFTCLLLIASVFVGVSAAKQLNFNVGIRFSPDYLCKVEVKSSSSSEFITIFNNSQPSAVHESYIEKIENNTLHLNLPELQTAMGATLNFRITNYTQTTAISATIESKDAQNAVLNTSTIKKIAAHDPAAAASSAETSFSISAGAYLCIEFSAYTAIMCNLTIKGPLNYYRDYTVALTRPNQPEVIWLKDKWEDCLYEDILELGETVELSITGTGGGFEPYPPTFEGATSVTNEITHVFTDEEMKEISDGWGNVYIDPKRTIVVGGDIIMSYSAPIS